MSLFCLIAIHKGYLNDTVVLTSAPDELLSSSSSTTTDLLPFCPTRRHMATNRNKSFEFCFSPPPLYEWEGGGVCKLVSKHNQSDRTSKKKKRECFKQNWLPWSDARVADFLHFGFDLMALDFRLRLFDCCRSGRVASQPECNGRCSFCSAATSFRFQDDRFTKADKIKWKSNKKKN